MHYKNPCLHRHASKQLFGAVLLMSIAICAYSQDAGIKSTPTDDEAALQAATKFVAELKSIDWTKITQPELRERMSKTVTPFGWTLNDARVARFDTNKGPRTTVEVMIEPTGICLKQSAWISLLGNPIGVTLADPFSFVEVEPADIQKTLTSHLSIATFHYRLNAADSFAFQHQHSTFVNQAPTKGCFQYLNVITNPQGTK